MDSLISTFHIDAKLLIAQMVNFIIVMGVLWWGGLKPLMKMMRDREQRISKSLDDATELEKRLKAMDTAYEAKLQEAQQHATKILEQADLDADEKVKQAVARARQEAELVVIKAKAQIEEQKNKTVAEARRELADVVVEAVQKITEEKLTGKHDRELVDEVISNVKINSR